MFVVTTCKILSLSPIRDVFQDDQILKSQVPVDWQVGLRRSPPTTLLLLLSSVVAANTISSSHCYRFLPQQGIGGRVGGWSARRLLAVIGTPCFSCSFGRRLYTSHVSLAHSPLPLCAAVTPRACSSAARWLTSAVPALSLFRLVQNSKRKYRHHGPLLRRQLKFLHSFSSHSLASRGLFSGVHPLPCVRAQSTLNVASLLSAVSRRTARGHAARGELQVKWGVFVFPHCAPVSERANEVCQPTGVPLSWEVQFAPRP